MQIPESRTGRPVGTYSSVGAAVRRLNVAEAHEIEAPDKIGRNRISSMLYTLSKREGMKYTTRVNRTANTLIIYRIK